MNSAIARLISRLTARFTRKYWGRTFRCPVCHFMLAAVDADANGLLVCPVCGVVIEIDEVYGHIVPVVHGVELFRPQPKLRLHPLATHLPIGLFPFALLGVACLFLASLLVPVGLPPAVAGLVTGAPVLADAVLVLLVISVAFVILTLVTGLRDWMRRYRRRPYRQISVKIIGAVAFLVLGTLAIALQLSGLVFAGTNGLIDVSQPLALLAALVYLGALLADMAILAVLGHVGGTLVFGR
jgi:uncharacterized C2H2 Zn-finger protein